MNTQPPAPLQGTTTELQPTPELMLSTLEKYDTVKKMLDASRTISMKAKEVADPVIKDFLKANLKTLTDLQLTELSSKLENIQERCIKGEKRQHDQRSPLTQAFDLLRSRFTAEENAVKNIKQQCAQYRGLINAEAKRRQDERANASLNATNIASEEIDYRTQFTAALKAQLTKKIASLKNECRAKINNSTDLLQSEASLKKWEPKLRADLVNQWASEFKFELFYLKEKPSFDVPLDEMENTFRSEMLPEKEFLLQEIAMRIAGITADPIPLIGDEEINQEVTVTKQATELQAASEKLEASFVATTSTASILPTVGDVPQKYAPTSHEHWARIMTWYVAEEMPHLSPAELADKFGFMLTKANNVLNATKRHISDVPRENDFTATARRVGRPKKTEKVA